MWALSGSAVMTGGAPPTITFATLDAALLTQCGSITIVTCRGVLLLVVNVRVAVFVGTGCTRPSEQVTENGALPVSVAVTVTGTPAQALMVDGSVAVGLGRIRTVALPDCAIGQLPAGVIGVAVSCTLPLAPAVYVIDAVPWPEVMTPFVIVHVEFV